MERWKKLGRISFAGAMISAVLSFVFLGWSGDRSTWFERYEGQFMSIDNVPEARERLGKFLVDVDRHGLTQGNTSVLWSTPENDLAFWYRRLEAVHQRLIQVEHQGDPALHVRTLRLFRQSLKEWPSWMLTYPHQRLHVSIGLFGIICSFVAFYCHRRVHRENSSLF